MKLDRLRQALARVVNARVDFWNAEPKPTAGVRLRALLDELGPVKPIKPAVVSVAEPEPQQFYRGQVSEPELKLVSTPVPSYMPRPVKVSRPAPPLVETTDTADCQVCGRTVSAWRTYADGSVFCLKCAFGRAIHARR